ncbi:MAG: phosphopantothenoylcysteine decarboxylase [bacterium]|nr:MAG: phosphopantothenoylcysteine decarboxylase [bacterium]
MTKSKVIIWGVSGGIAIYKSLDMISTLKKLGHEIHVVMTANATKMIQPVTFQAISQNPVLTDTFEEAMTHISLADQGDIFIIAPATYNIIGKIAHGIADDLLTTLASAVTCRKLMAPAMNTHMYENSILQKNLKLLKENDYEIIEPDHGMLACGYEGTGRLRRVEDILNEIIGQEDGTNKKLLTGKRVLITAGGTRERIDPVRFIGNFSSGKMGVQLAKACLDQGAEVTLVYGHVQTHLPQNIRCLHAESAQELLDVLEKEISDIDILIMAAAVGDYRVDQVQSHKIKKTSTLTLNLKENPDIIKCLNQHKKKGQVFIGFAAESENMIDHAKTKLKEKTLDMIIANDITEEGVGFHSPENRVTVLLPGGKPIPLPRMDKYLLSVELVKLIHKNFISD